MAIYEKLEKIDDSPSAPEPEELVWRTKVLL